MKELEAWDGSTNVWKPEPGETVVGVLQRMETWETENGPANVAVIAQEATGELLWVFVTSAVLKKLWQQDNPLPGDRVGIKFAGQPEGKEYNLYALVVDKAARPMKARVSEISPPALDDGGSDPFEED